MSRTANSEKVRKPSKLHLVKRLDAIAGGDLTSVDGPDIYRARQATADLLKAIEAEIQTRGPCEHRWHFLSEGFEFCVSDCGAIRKADHEPPPRRAQHEASRDNVMIRIRDHLDTRAAEYEASGRTAPPRRAAGSNVIPFPKMATRRDP